MGPPFKVEVTFEKGHVSRSRGSSSSGAGGSRCTYDRVIQTKAYINAGIFTDESAVQGNHNLAVAASSYPLLFFTTP
jgi:hypothetical protein